MVIIYSYIHSLLIFASAKMDYSSIISFTTSRLSYKSTSMTILHTWFVNSWYRNVGLTKGDSAFSHLAVHYSVHDPNPENIFFILYCGILRSYTSALHWTSISFIPLSKKCFICLPVNLLITLVQRWFSTLKCIKYNLQIFGFFMTFESYF